MGTGAGKVLLPILAEKSEREGKCLQERKEGEKNKMGSVNEVWNKAAI